MRLAFLTVLLSLAASARAETGFAKIQGTAPDSKISGTARFEDTKDGLKVTVSVQGVEGAHALHIHEFGDCSDSGKAAGGHYNPEGHQHGDALKEPKKAHAGDFGTVTAQNGALVLEATLKRAKLTDGKNSVAGRAIVLHEKADDFSQPTGNAGGRVACGVIVLVGAK